MARKLSASIFRQEGSENMRRNSQGQTEARGGRHGRTPARRTVPFAFTPALACLLFLSGCANLPDWLPDLTGGEGKIAQRVPSSVIDAPPSPDEGSAEPAQPTEPADPADPAEPADPSSAEVRAVQTDLAELGYDPGAADGAMGPMTKRAIEAYQKDAELKADGRITPELTASLAAAPRPEGADPHEMAAAEQPAEDAPEHPAENAPEAETTQDMPAEPAAAPFIVKNADAPPIYGAGDTYIWSTGQVETVARIVGNKLVWEVNNGVRFNADRNFLIPPSSWTGPTGTGEANAQVDARAAWPLATDSPLVFRVEENGAVAAWRCESLGGEMVSVPAGRFEAVALACERTPAPPGGWVRRIWLYAPVVRHYVARIDIMADGSRKSKRLMGIRPGAEGWPPAVRAGLDRAIQNALEDVPGGGKKVWTSTGVEEEFEIRPGPIRNSANSGRCRRFELTARSAKGSRFYPAMACTPGDGETWRIPSDEGQGLDGVTLLMNAG